MSHWRCCCGGSPPTPGCQSAADCVACGTLVFRISGTWERVPVPAIPSSYQRWIDVTCSIRVRSTFVAPNPCRWLNNPFQSAPQRLAGDFLGYSGSYEETISGSYRSATFDLDEADVDPGGVSVSTWAVDHSCDPSTEIETFSMQGLGEPTGPYGMVAPDDQTGALLGVGWASFTFSRAAVLSCPVGIYVPTGAAVPMSQYPTLPSIEIIEP